jgi:hypothetical protein
MKAQLLLDRRPKRRSRGRRRREHAALMELRERLHLAVRFQIECAQRLDELHAGAIPVCADEAEVVWSCLALGLDHERALARDYMIAAGFKEHQYGD